AARVENLLGKAEQLWRDIYRLEARLERAARHPGEGPQGPPPPAVAAPDEGPLARQTAPILQAFAEIRDDFNAQCQRLQRDARLPQVRQQIEDVLTVPLIPSRLRLDLLRISREISLRLSQTGRPSLAPQGPPTEPDEEQARRAALEAGRREGRLALAL